jgi:hypothetical protein
MRISKLCATCQRLFEGPELLPEIDNVPFEDTQSLPYDEYQTSDEESRSTTSQEQADERDVPPPKLPPRVSRTPAARIVKHHTVPSLILAAASGCHLCNLFLQHLPTGSALREWAHKDHRTLMEERSSLLDGIVVLNRPPAEDSSDVLNLKLSFHIKKDGAPVHVYGPIWLTLHPTSSRQLWNGFHDRSMLTDSMAFPRYRERPGSADQTSYSGRY